jgi:acetoin utilization deacetylase AcuC-like enzyme
MELRVYYDERVLAHDNGPGHPERSERVSTALQRVKETDYGVPTRIVAPEPAGRSELERVHRASYVDQVEASSRRDRTVFDADTAANRHSWLAARLAAGGAVEAVRAALRDEQVRSFVLMRPPGHHAEADHAMGFCLFNNAAIAAADALNSGAKKVAIVDWDVHHGNGTEHAFYDRCDVCYVSVHQAAHYPGTGRRADVGEGAGAGHTVNVPLPAGSGGAEYLRVMDELVVPVLEQYEPEVIMVSAGFDAHERDPLAGMLLNRSDYYQITNRLRACADACCGGRIVHLLEGGYDLGGLADGVDAVLRSLAGTGEA